MTEQEILWWVTCISANRFRFGFGRQANRTLKDLNLPPQGAMSTWIATTNIDCYMGAEAPAQANTKELSNSSQWKAFGLQDLFDIKKGQRLTKENMLAGDVPYVGASDSRNGITARIGQLPIHQGGTISVSYNGSVAEAFFQPEPYWATDDVNVLYPRNFQLNAARGLFLCAIIRIEKYRFNYGRKWHLDRMRESIIKLPNAMSGDPDWPYMEAYINSLRYSSQIDPGAAKFATS